MKPRVFVSSTYYDLKYIRDDLNKFICRYGFTPSLFEAGGVTFEHGKGLDTSCYKEIGHCNMLILIVGGRYGSKASDRVEAQKEQEDYEKSVVSITQKEFRTACDLGIPVYVFIDKNVFGEYHTYLKNKDLMHVSDIQFAHVDSINIFKFIDEIKTIGLYIGQFEHFSEIEEVLVDQWSGLFYEYLNQLMGKKQDEYQINAINELKNVVQKMEVMLQKIGTTQLQPEQIETVQREQLALTLNNICTGITGNISFREENADADYKHFADRLIDCIRYSVDPKESAHEIFSIGNEYNFDVSRINLGVFSNKGLIEEYLQHNSIESLKEELAKCLGQRRG